MTINFEFLSKFYDIVCFIYDYFVKFADYLINKTVIQTYAGLSTALEDFLLEGPPDNVFEHINPLRGLKWLVDQIVFSGIANTPLASMPTYAFLLTTFITLSLGVAFLKIFK